MHIHIRLQTLSSPQKHSFETIYETQWGLLESQINRHLVRPIAIYIPLVLKQTSILQQSLNNDEDEFHMNWKIYKPKQNLEPLPNFSIHSPFKFYNLNFHIIALMI